VHEYAQVVSAAGSIITFSLKCTAVSDWEEWLCCFEEAMSNSWNISRTYPVKPATNLESIFVTTTILLVTRGLLRDKVSKDFFFF